MRNLVLLFQVVIFTLITSGFHSVQAQNNWCGQVTQTEKLIKENPQLLPSIIKSREQLEQETRDYETPRGARAVKIVPVVFHVIHLNGIENISDAQINDQMRIFNEDYNMSNADLSNVVSSFTNIIGDMQIEFRLAKLDPNGAPTNGIDRIVSSKTNQGGDGAKLNPWPRNKYLNIWVIKNWKNGIPSGVLAYAYLPSGAQNRPSVDGVIVKSQFVGSIGTGRPVYARTLTHEVGHYLNLSHTWGNSNNPGKSSNCNGDDGVSDTPNCIGTFSCNTSKKSCGSLDNIQNHMDYADCTVMFSKGQGTRMNAALNSSISQRNNLSTPANLLATGVSQLTVANFSATRLTGCEYDQIDFTDKSEYGATSWDWKFPNSYISNSTDKNPSVTFSKQGLYDVNLSVSSGTHTKTENKVGYIMVNPKLGKHAPFTDDFSGVTQLNHENWYAINDLNDAFLFTADATNGYNGGNCLRVKNHTNTSLSKDELHSTTYDLRVFTKVNVSFKIAYAQISNSDFSKMTLYISGNCGQTWSPRWSANGSNLSNGKVQASAYTPNGPSDYKTFTVSNISGTVLSQTSQFKLVFENKSGNHLYLDDFAVTGTYTKSAKLKYPFNGMTAMPNNQTISWKAIGGAEAYEYQLDLNPSFNSSDLQTGVKNYTGTTDGPETEYIPSTLVNGKIYYWRVRLIIGGAAQSWSQPWVFTVADNGVSTQDLLREKYSFVVFPNPMKEVGVISFSLTKGEDITLQITDIVGKSSVIIAQQYYGEGKHIFNLSELKLQPGMYIVSLKAGNESVYQKIVVQ